MDGRTTSTRESWLDTNDPVEHVPAPPTGSPPGDSGQRAAHPAAADDVLSPLFGEPPSPDSFVQRKVVGPHGTPLADVRSGLSPHPNSPGPSSAGAGAGAVGGPRRLVAVIWSPASNLPRKTSLQSAAVLQQMPPAMAAASAPASGASVPGVKLSRRLGWYVKYEGEAMQLLSAVAETLSKQLGVDAQLEAPQLRLTTAEVHVSRDMGLGKMSAQMIVSAHETEEHCYRLDVKRKTGDTFQFHAFYRGLREALAWLNGWTGATYAGAASVSGAAPAGQSAGTSDEGRGAAGWGQRM